MSNPAETLWANAGLFPSAEAIRDHLLFGLLQEGSPIPADYPAQLAAAGICFPGQLFGLIGLQYVAVDAWSYITGLGHTSYSGAHLAVNLLELFRTRSGNRQDVQVFKAQNDILCIVCGDIQSETERKLREVARQLLSLEAELAGVRLFANLSQVRPGYESLGLARPEVRQLSEFRVLQLDTDPILDTAVLARPVDYYSERPDIQKEQALLAAFRSGNYREASALFDSLWSQEYLMLASPLLLIKHKCVQYLSSLFRATEELLDRPLEPLLSTLAPEQRLLTAGSYPEVRAQMEHIFGYLNDLVIAGKKSHPVSWVTDVRDYVRSHYSDPELNVNRVAAEFGRNPSYLSRSFLRATGTSVLDYIHRYRIQEAKILIGRGETIAEAAHAVGYSNVLTMSRAFKKYEGTTPGKLKKE